MNSATKGESSIEMLHFVLRRDGSCSTVDSIEQKINRPAKRERDAPLFTTFEQVSFEKNGRVKKSVSRLPRLQPNHVVLNSAASSPKAASVPLPPSSVGPAPVPGSYPSSLNTAVQQIQCAPVLALPEPSNFQPVAMYYHGGPVFSISDNSIPLPSSSSPPQPQPSPPSLSPDIYPSPPTGLDSFLSDLSCIQSIPESSSSCIKKIRQLLLLERTYLTAEHAQLQRAISSSESQKSELEQEVTTLQSELQNADKLLTFVSSSSRSPALDSVQQSHCAFFLRCKWTNPSFESTYIPYNVVEISPRCIELFSLKKEMRYGIVEPIAEDDFWKRFRWQEDFEAAKLYAKAQEDGKREFICATKDQIWGKPMRLPYRDSKGRRFDVYVIYVIHMSVQPPIGEVRLIQVSDKYYPQLECPQSKS